MKINTWTSGYKVEAADWYDGKHVYLGISYYRPGSNLGQPPCWEKNVLLDVADLDTITNYLDSVVNHIVNYVADDDPCVLSIYQDGKEVYRRKEEGT